MKKNKCKKQPPLIVILDVIFIFLFALILKPEDKGFFVKVPQDMNPKFCYTIVLKDSEITHYYDEKSHIWEEFIFFKDYDKVINVDGSTNTIITCPQRELNEKIKKESKNKTPDGEICAMVYDKPYINILQFMYIDKTRAVYLDEDSNIGFLND